MTPLPTLEARVRPHNDERGHSPKCLAFVELTIGGAFVIKGIKILQQTGDDGDPEPFVVFPAEKGKGIASARWYDLAFPCTIEARVSAIKTILDAYAKTQGDQP